MQREREREWWKEEDSWVYLHANCVNFALCGVITWQHINKCTAGTCPPPHHSLTRGRLTRRAALNCITMQQKTNWIWLSLLLAICIIIISPGIWWSACRWARLRGALRVSSSCAAAVRRPWCNTWHTYPAVSRSPRSQCCVRRSAGERDTKYDQQGFT